jgi:hypothetical protein
LEQRNEGMQRALELVFLAFCGYAHFVRCHFREFCEVEEIQRYIDDVIGIHGCFGHCISLQVRKRRYCVEYSRERSWKMIFAMHGCALFAFCAVENAAGLAEIGR